LTSSANDYDRLMAGAAAGDAGARDKLLAAHYEEFRRIARRILQGGGGSLHIDPTDLAHEAALRLIHNGGEWRDRTHFLAVSARAMRQPLIDEVRRFKASKRQAPEFFTDFFQAEGRKRLPLDEVDDALERLFAIDPERGRIVELRFYAGLTLTEIAEALNLSQSRVERRWRSARAWLLDALSDRTL
jgi:RNA polymerase sigma factor (TIGR02999 family)